VLGACGGDDAETSTSGAAAAGVTITQLAVRPEETIAPDTEVTAGAAKRKGVARRVANGGGRTASKKPPKGLDPVWRQIESTVETNEAALCLDVEDGFQCLEGGDRGSVTASAAR
jgi:hypothetical protein